MTKEIHLAHTQGFCAGVSTAIETVELALKKYGAPLYVRHAIVHNNAVIENFEKQGVVFIESLEEVPEGSTVVFSAHGVAPNVYDSAKKRNLRYIDATCALVTKVHRNAIRFSSRNIQTILIGHKGHQELIGTSGYVQPELLHIIESEEDIDHLNIDPEKPVGFLTQTTLSVSETAAIIDKLQKKYPEIQGAKRSDICYATQNRQDAVMELSKECDVVIICGSPHSSNSNRLREQAATAGIPAYIIDRANELDPSWVEDHQKIGISSGASVPRFIVDELVEKLKTMYPGAKVFESESIETGIHFPLPQI